MMRERTPQPRSSAYITPAGWQRLREELDYLWRERRPAVTQALADAAAEGDRSENAEYIYRKKELRAIDRRVRYLSKRLDVLTIVSRKPQDTSRVFFGARVALSGPDGNHHYRIVGPDETDAASGAISVDSPLARALLKHAVGDVIVARLPGCTAQHEILDIQYADP